MAQIFYNAKLIEIKKIVKIPEGRFKYVLNVLNTFM